MARDYRAERLGRLEIRFNKPMYPVRFNKKELRMDLTTVSFNDLKDEKAKASGALLRLQGLIADVPWADWEPIYNQIGHHLDNVRSELDRRKIAPNT